MKFKEGNKDAEKWTEETALEFIEKVHNFNISNKANYHLGYSITSVGGYVDLWAYLGKKFKDNEAVFRTIKKVEQFLEARIINSTLTGDAKSTAMAIFYLKNKHNYKDKTEHDHTTGGDKINTPSLVLPEGQTMKDVLKEMQDIQDGGN